jgi:hypothetical protein
MRSDRQSQTERHLESNWEMKAEMRKPGAASKSRGRGPCKEGRMPEPDHRTGFDHWSGASQLNQDDEGRGYRRRGGGMEHDTELAMIGVSGGGVDVRHLHHGQQGQQNQAQNRRGHRKCAPPCVGAVWLESVQKDVTPYFQDTQNWMLPYEERLHHVPNRPAAYLLDMLSSKM